MSHSTGIVLFFVNYYPPHVGGLERYVEGLARALVQVSEYEIHVITHRDHPDLPDVEVTGDGVCIHRIDAVLSVADVFCVPHPIQLWRVLRGFSKSRIRGVSIHTRFFPISLIGAFCGRWWGTKVVFTEHGSDHVRFPSSRMIEWVSRVYDWTLGRLTIALASIQSGSSKSAASFAARLGGKNVRVLENAVNIEFWSQMGGGPHDHFVYVGRIASGKGWDIAVKAHQSQESEFRKRYPLILIGDGAEATALMALIKGDPHIHFLGTQGQEVIRTHLHRAVTLNPTQLSEGLQTILIEAAASQSWILSSPTLEAVRLLNHGFGECVTTDWAKAMRESIHKQPIPGSQLKLAHYSWKNRAETFLKWLGEA